MFISSKGQVRLRRSTAVLVSGWNISPHIRMRLKWKVPNTIFQADMRHNMENCFDAPFSEDGQFDSEFQRTLAGHHANYLPSPYRAD
jgi:hypothetical protein